MTTGLRVGVLGAGGIAERAMVEPSREIDGVEVVAIGARDPERAAAFAARLGLPKWGDYEAVLADPDIDLVYLALPPIVHAGGTITAGNASGINDGSGALLLASEAAVRAHGLTPRARYVAAAVAGVAPRVMGIGPVPAVEKLLARTSLTLDRVDVIELNEAFAAQALAVLRALGVPDDAPHVNPNGGAIALGHPLGMSGARLALTATEELHRKGGRYALCTMCIGVGQGIAMVIERV